MHSIFIARQPIFDRNLNILGYEILCRSGEVNWSQASDEEQAAARTIIGTFLDVGIDTVAGSSLVFVDVPREFLLNARLIPMFEGQSVLEIGPGVNASPDVTASFERLRQEGYQIALDEFDVCPHRLSLLPYADYVKINVKAFDAAQLSRILANLDAHSCKSIALRVDSQELLERCRDLGFDAFQGNFFSKPLVLERDSTDSSRSALLALLEVINHPEKNLAEIAEALSHDVVLSYKLLRYINSAAFPGRREVESLTDALMLVGIDAVRNWASMLVMTDLFKDEHHELYMLSLVRARMCELLAARQAPVIASQMFTVGLFSVLDAIFGMTMIELLDEVSLTAPIRLALLDFEGEHGRLLKQVIQYEHGETGDLARDYPDTSDLCESYMNAVQWARQTMAALNG